MAFQIKKDLHLNTGIYLKLLSDPTSAKVEKDMFDNERYTLPIEMIGHDLTDGSGVKWFQNDKGEWIELKIGKQTDFEFSGALYKKLVGNSSGSTVQVMLKEINGEKGTYAGWSVTPMSGGNHPLEVLNSPKKVVSSNSLGITWGMCINNATKILISWKEDYETLDFMRDQIEDVAFVLMDVATNGLKRWEQEQQENDQNDKPSEEEQEKPNNEDVPF
tara:strand:+ start:579 stop:1232 length:654 start_codon:yes stop_codon:yes gene_type:complete